MNYYRKSLPRVPLLLSNGKKFTGWDLHPDGYGYLQTDDEFLDMELGKFITRRSGGVTAITKEQFDEAVQKKTTTPIPKQSSGRQCSARPNRIPPPAQKLQPKSPEAVDAGTSASAINHNKRPDQAPFQPGTPMAALRGKWRPTRIGKLSDMKTDNLDNRPK